MSAAGPLNESYSFYAVSPEEMGLYFKRLNAFAVDCLFENWKYLCGDIIHVNKKPIPRLIL
jgi:hypothetical protein